MPDDKTIDFVVMFLTIGMVTLGLLSMLVGWIVKQYDNLMSRWTAREETIAPSVSKTDSRQTADRPTQTTIGRQEVLTLLSDHARRRDRT